MSQIQLPQPQFFEPPDQPPISLPLGEWLPDQPSYNNDGSPDIQNVLVASAKSYGPAPSFTLAVNNALRHRVQGAAGFVDNSGNVNLFAGDNNDLYLLNSTTALFTVVSSSSHAYSVAAKDYWKFTYFNGTVIATQLANVIQKYALGVDSAFSALAAGAPKAKYIANWNDSFIALAFTNDGSDDPQRVWWSGAGDATSWPTPGSAAAAAVQSGYVNLYNDLGVIQGIVGGLANADGAVFQEHGVKRVTYQGPPGIFAFSPCEGVRGTAAPGSICMVPGGLCFYYGEDGFYKFDGGSSVPIGAGKVDQWFSKNTPFQWLYRMVGVVDPLTRNVLWGFAGLDSQNGECTKTLVYNYYYDRWTLLNVSVQFLAQFIGIGWTLDQLYTVFGYTVDTVPFPFDSNVWIGGRYLFAGFDLNNKLVYPDGPALAARCATKTVEIFPGRRSLFRGGRVLMEGGGDPYLACGKQESLQDTVTYTTSTVRNSLGTNPGRTSGRYLSGLITTLAGDSWTHLMGAELDVTEMKGKR